MKIKLIKRKAADSADNKSEQSPSPADLMLNAQSWVEEFKARKAQDVKTLRAMLERSAA